MKDSTIREQAFALRKQGYSYTYIGEKTAISKGTLSAWLSSVPYTPNNEMLLKMGKARTASGLAKNKQKLRSFAEAVTQARKDIGALSSRDVFMLGVGLYIGEGAKTHDIIRVINSDPKVIRFAVKWFRDVCDLKQVNFRLRLHLYPDSDEAKSVAFWSKSTSIAPIYFQKTYVDIRKDKKSFNRRKLPFGTAHLSIRSHGRKEFGVFLARRINGWIDEVLK